MMLLARGVLSDWGVISKKMHGCEIQRWCSNRVNRLPVDSNMCITSLNPSQPALHRGCGNGCCSKTLLCGAFMP